MTATKSFRITGPVDLISGKEIAANAVFVNDVKIHVNGDGWYLTIGDNAQETTPCESGRVLTTDGKYTLTHKASNYSIEFYINTIITVDVKCAGTTSTNFKRGNYKGTVELSIDNEKFPEYIEEIRITNKDGVLVGSYKPTEKIAPLTPEDTYFLEIVDKYNRTIHLRLVDDSGNVLAEKESGAEAKFIVK